MRCDHCPVRCELTCVAERFNARNLCAKVNPASPDYKEGYRQIVQDKTCGTETYVNKSKAGVVEQTEEKKEMPSLTVQAGNLMKSMGGLARAAWNGQRIYVDQKVLDERLSICNGCDQLDKEDKRCFACGCYVEKKAMFSHERCPKDKWLPVEQPKLPAPAKCGSCNSNRNP